MPNKSKNTHTHSHIHKLSLKLNAIGEQKNNAKKALKPSKRKLFGFSFVFLCRWSVFQFVWLWLWRFWSQKLAHFRHTFPFYVYFHQCLFISSIQTKQNAKKKNEQTNERRKCARLETHTALSELKIQWLFFRHHNHRISEIIAVEKR